MTCIFAMHIENSRCNSKVCTLSLYLTVLINHLLITRNKSCPNFIPRDNFLDSFTLIHLNLVFLLQLLPCFQYFSVRMCNPFTTLSRIFPPNSGNIAHSNAGSSFVTASTTLVKCLTEERALCCSHKSQKPTSSAEEVVTEIISNVMI